MTIVLAAHCFFLPERLGESSDKGVAIQPIVCTIAHVFYF
jgi:hypothetical protein